MCSAWCMRQACAQALVFGDTRLAAGILKTMHRIDPVNIQLFLAAAREGSIKRAAETEHIAQSALAGASPNWSAALGWCCSCVRPPAWC